MERRQVHCDKCGANLFVENSTSVFYCQYCGAKIKRGEEYTYNYNETKRIINDAKLKREERLEN